METDRTSDVPFDERELRGFRFFGRLRRHLKPLRGDGDHPNRLFRAEDYAALLLFYFLNPVIDSLRSLQRASGLASVQKKLDLRRVSLGSLSESSGVFDPELLGEVFRELARSAPAAVAPRPGPRGVPADLRVLAADGTLLAALPRMVWALWQDDSHRAAKIHLRFDCVRGLPVGASITPGNASERTELLSALEPGSLYVLDRGYAGFPLFSRVLDAGASLVARVNANTVSETVETRPLADADRAAGVLSDDLVVLGCRAKAEPLAGRTLRLVRIKNKGKSARAKSDQPAPEASPRDVLLVTDRLDLPAESVAALYRWRWHVELFFRWMKCVLGFRHLIAHDEAGVKFQVYAALIASLLVATWTGRRPTKATFEMIQHYLSGWATPKELVAHIRSLKSEA